MGIKLATSKVRKDYLAMLSTSDIQHFYIKPEGGDDLTKTLLNIRHIIRECEDYIEEENPSDYAKDQERLNAYKQIVEEVTYKGDEVKT